MCGGCKIGHQTNRDLIERTFRTFLSNLQLQAHAACSCHSPKNSRTHRCQLSPQCHTAGVKPAVWATKSSRNKHIVANYPASGCFWTCPPMPARIMTEAATTATSNGQQDDDQIQVGKGSKKYEQHWPSPRHFPRDWLESWAHCRFISTASEGIFFSSSSELSLLPRCPNSIETKRRHLGLSKQTPPIESHHSSRTARRNTMKSWYWGSSKKSNH